jgi:PAS domain S-box-containing protein
MPVPRRLSTAQRVIALAAPSALVLTLGLFAYAAIQRSVEATESVTRAHRVSLRMEAMVGRLFDVVTAERGYLITGEERFLQPLAGARVDIHRHMDTLRTLIRDPAQGERAEGLLRLVDAQLDLAEGSLALGRAGDLEAARSAARLGEAKVLLDGVRRAIDEIQRVQHAIVADRRARAARSVRSLALAVLLGSLAAVAVAVLTNLLLLGHARAQEQLAREVDAQNSQLQDQAAELEMQTAELQSQAAHLEETMVELEMANDELQGLNRALQEAEEQKSVLLESAGDGIYGVNHEGRCTFLNRAGAVLLGYAPDEVVGRNMHELVHHRRRDGSAYPEEDCPVYRAARTGEGVRVEGEVLWRKDGTPLPVEYASYPLLGRESTRGAVVTFRDVRERLRVEAERDLALADAEEARRVAEEANRAKLDFLSAMSHELRTPLNAIAGYVDLLDLGIYGSTTPEQLEALDRIRHNEEALLALIDDILHYAKIEAGRVTFEIGEMAVSELLSQVEPLIEPQVRASGHVYTVAGGGVPLRARGDRDRTRQILLNLLVNATKFTPAGGRIEVTCEGDERSVRIRVRDTGRGIPAELIPTVFDPFVQGERSRHESSRQGVGLGLAISRELAEGMGGRLTVQSVVGEGSTFTLTLPAAAFGDGVPERGSLPE